uniref:Uncharacterized protein n=1 Tax=Glossina pallidipes TaxID=7398 RepID=A0A1A9ZT94_GLOPL
MKAKMNDHHNNLQKGHFLEDNRLDHHSVTTQGGGVLGPTGAVAHHGNHVGHHGSAAAAALLVVPQPINATKIGASLGGSGGGGGTGGGGTGRKYQCKMCPQHNEKSVVLKNNRNGDRNGFEEHFASVPVVILTVSYFDN